MADGRVPKTLKIRPEIWAEMRVTALLCNESVPEFIEAALQRRINHLMAWKLKTESAKMGED